MRRLASLALGFTLSMTVGLSPAGCASSDDLCDEACEYWDSCTQVEGNYVNYTYDQCYDECKDEGDWNRAYVNCLAEQTTCPALGNQCG